jgi:hypothetical protein
MAAPIKLIAAQERMERLVETFRFAWVYSNRADLLYVGCTCVRDHVFLMRLSPFGPY